MHFSLAVIVEDLNVTLSEKLKPFSVGMVYNEKTKDIDLTNPDGKFDWYVIGGRYASSLRNLEDERVTIVKISEMSLKPELDWEDYYNNVWDFSFDSPRLKEAFKSKAEFMNLVLRFYTTAFLTHDNQWIAHEDFDLPGKFQESFYKYLAQHQDKYIIVVDCHD